MSKESAAVEFIERMGLAAEAEGLPPIAARLFAFMLIEGGPCTADEIAEKLQVSRGSVSTNTRLLEGRGAIERFTRPGERQHYFRISDDPFGRKFEQLPEHMFRFRNVVAEARQSLPEDMVEAKERLAEAEEFCEFAIEISESNLRAWRERRKKKSRAE
jgi:DNA-binding transcriptional regulator GbsR (MarR family)